MGGVRSRPRQLLRCVNFKNNGGAIAFQVAGLLHDNADVSELASQGRVCGSWLVEPPSLHDFQDEGSFLC